MAYKGPHVSHRKYTPEQDAEIADLRLGGMSLQALCDKFGGSLPSMRASLRRSGIASKKTGRPKWRTFTEEQTADVVGLWAEGCSQTYIAKKYGTTQSLISDLLIRQGQTPEQRLSHARGEKHGSWKGGRHVTKEGYVWVRVQPDTPFKEMAHGHNYIPEHRLVVAIALGRALTDKETVHHINLDHGDNRIENLQLRRGQHGKGTVSECADCGSHNIIFVPLAEVAQKSSGA